MKLNIGWTDWQLKRQIGLLAFRKGIFGMIENQKGN